MSKTIIIYFEYFYRFASRNPPVFQNFSQPIYESSSKQLNMSFRYESKIGLTESFTVMVNCKGHRYLLKNNET